MKDHVYKIIEITGTSASSIEDAVQRAIRRANKSIRKLGWFQVVMACSPRGPDGLMSRSGKAPWPGPANPL